MRIFVFLFSLLFIANTVHAESITLVGDSLTIKGRIIWKDHSITGYPSNIVFTSLDNQGEKLVQKVDSTGRFKQTLVYGKYNISPQLNYHWIGEELIRIDAEKSKLSVDINADSEQDIIIKLDTIAWPVNTL
ncbi:MAG: hypothetical protein AAFO07_25785, partial [Bacteroidota bacterium]